MLDVSVQKALQEVFILATGRGANSNEMEMLGGWSGSNGDWAPLIDVVNAYMTDQAAAHGTAATFQTLALNGLGLTLSDSDAAGLAPLIDSGQMKWADVFVIVMNWTDELGQTLDNRAEAAHQFLADLSTAGKSAYFTGSPVNDAVHNLLQGISDSAQSLATGEKGLEALTTRLSASGIKTSVVDGYIAGATVFVDANGDGKFSTGEFSTTTDASGNFLLPATTSGGTLIANGGVDILTGKEFHGAFTAPSGSTVVNPLTTLIENLVAGGASVAGAAASVQQALGLPVDINLLSYDPIAVLADANATTQDKAAALLVERAALKVANIIAIAGSAINASSANIDLLAATGAVTQALAAAMTGGKAIDLADHALLTDRIQVAIATAGASSLIDQASDIASLIAGSNHAAEGAADIRTLAQSAVIAQGNALDALVQAIEGGQGLAGVLASFTGKALTDAIHTAEVGEIVHGQQVPGPGPDPVPEPGPGPDPVPEPGPGPDPVPEPGPGPDPVPEPGPVPDPAPTLTGSHPSDNGTMEFDQGLSLGFSESIYAGTGTLRLYQANGSLVESFDVATGMGGAGGTVAFWNFPGKGGNIYVNPGADLLPGTDYYLQIDPTALKDSTDHSYAGISDNTTLNFKAVDSVPTLSGSDPSDNGTMEFDRNLSLWFSENIHAGTGTLRLYQADGTPVESFDVATGLGGAGGSLSFNGSSVDINPKGDLLPGTDYYLQIDPTALKDSTDHSYAGISDNTTLNFKAVDSVPTLSWSDPSDNGTLEFNRDIGLHFSENIHAGTGTILLYQADGTVVESFDVATGIGGAGGSVMFQGLSVAVNPQADLLPGTDYYLQIDPTALKDSTDHSYAGISDNTTLNFKAVDSVPTLNGSNPSDNGTMEVDQSLSLYFSENIHAGTGTIRLYQADGTVVESFNVATGVGEAGGSLSFNGSSVLLNPKADLLPGTDYYCVFHAIVTGDFTKA